MAKHRGKHGLRRRLRGEALEGRRLLAAHISEVAFDPLFGGTEDSYIELRGAPGAPLPSGSYLVAVDEGSSFDRGEINAVVDLGGLSFGSNGYLAILPADSPHEVDPAATVLRSTSDGFAGLPGGRFESDVDDNSRFEFILGATGFFLVTSASRPVVGETIDADDDGRIDASVSWNEMDSISMHPFVGRGDYAYGRLVMAEIGTGEDTIATRPGAAVVWSEGFGYVGRIGESTGHAPDDWIAATYQDQADLGEEPVWGLADNLFGEPTQYEFAGRDLDNVGSANFVGAVGGVVTDVDGSSAPGVEVFLDLNDNGIRDTVRTVVDPDDLETRSDFTDEDYPVINAFPGVTVTNFALGTFPAHEVTAENQRERGQEQDNRIFAKGGIDWFQDNNQLRFDFYRPVSGVSIDALGDDNSLVTIYGRLDAFDADGNLVATTLSSPLGQGDRVTLSVDSGTDNITYVMAYADTELEDGEQVGELDPSPFGRFDRMTFTRPEPATVTDAQGRYAFDRLTPGRYVPTAVGGDAVATADAFIVTAAEHGVRDLRFDDAPPPPPPPPTQVLSIPTEGWELAENSPAGSTVGTVQVAVDSGVLPAVTFALVDPPAGFDIDPETGVVSVVEGADLDYEAIASVPLVVTASADGLSPVQKTVTVTLTDVDEAPAFATDQMVSTSASGSEVAVSLSDVAISDPEGDPFQLAVDPASLPEFLRFDTTLRQLRGLASTFFAGVHDVVFRAISATNPDVFDTLTVTLTITPGELPFRNATLPADVDGDGTPDALDALRVLNHLRINGGPGDLDPATRLRNFVDVDGDNAVSPLDALVVLNEIRRRRLAGAGEPVQSPVALASAVADGIDHDDRDRWFAQYPDEPGLF